MFGLFRSVAQLFDHSLDRTLEGPAGPGFGKAMGAIGTVMVASAMGIAGAVLVWSAGREVPAPSYYLVRPGKPPARLPVLHSPALSVEKITNWSARAVSEIFRMNFRDVDKRMDQNSVYFTAPAWRDFVSSMETSGIIEDIKEQRQFVLLTPLEEAQLVDSPVINGKRMLRVEIPVLLTYIAGAKPTYQRHFLELLIEPVPTTEDPEGLAIAKLRAHPYR